MLKIMKNRQLSNHCSAKRKGPFPIPYKPFPAPFAHSLLFLRLAGNLLLVSKMVPVAGTPWPNKCFMFGKLKYKIVFKRTNKQTNSNPDYKRVASAPLPHCNQAHVHWHPTLLLYQNIEVHFIAIELSASTQSLIPYFVGLSLIYWRTPDLCLNLTICSSMAKLCLG